MKKLITLLLVAAMALAVPAFGATDYKIVNDGTPTGPVKLRVFGGGTWKDAWSVNPVNGQFTVLSGFAISSFTSANGSDTAPGHAFQDQLQAGMWMYTDNGFMTLGTGYLRLTGQIGFGSVFEGRQMQLDSVPGISKLLGQQAFYAATTNVTGGDVVVGGGVGTRKFTILSNTAGTLAVTIGVDGTFVTLTSGTDFTLGTDNTAPQLAVTASNLAAAIVANSTINAKVSAFANAAEVRVVKKDIAHRLVLGSRSPDRVSSFGGSSGLALIPSPLVAGDTILGTDVAPRVTTIAGESAYPLATTNVVGGAVEVAGGIGKRTYTVLTNTAGATIITITVDGTAVPLTSPTNYALGSDNTSPQLAVTATNIANAINADGTLNTKVFASAVADTVLLTKKAGTRTVTLASNQVTRISFTGTDDGAVKLYGPTSITYSSPAPTPANNPSLSIFHTGNNVNGRQDGVMATCNFAAALNGSSRCFSSTLTNGNAGAGYGIHGYAVENTASPRSFIGVGGFANTVNSTSSTSRMVGGFFVAGDGGSANDGTHVGTVGYARRTTSATVGAGGYFALVSTLGGLATTNSPLSVGTTLPNTSGAVVANNGDTSLPIFVGQNNGVNLFQFDFDGTINGQWMTTDVATTGYKFLGQSAWSQSATNTSGSNVSLSGGIGRRFFTAVSNTAGAVTVTLTVDGTTSTYVSTTNFALGSDNTAPQLAVTATNLAAAINADATQNTKVLATASSANIFIDKKASGTQAVFLTSNQTGRISLTQGTDGSVTAIGSATTGSAIFNIKNIDGLTTGVALNVTDKANAETFRILTNGDLQQMVNGTFNFKSFAGANYWSISNGAVFTMFPTMSGTFQYTATVGGAVTQFNLNPTLQYNAGAAYKTLAINAVQGTAANVPTSGTLAEFQFNGGTQFSVKDNGDTQLAGYIGSPISGSTSALAGLGAGNVTTGTHSYKVTFLTAAGESIPSVVSNTITTSAGNGQVALTNVPLSNSSYVTGRKIYRSAAGNAVTGPWLLLTTISDNTTTTFADNVADGSLGATAPSTATATQGAVTLATGTLTQATMTPTATANVKKVISRYDWSTSMVTALGATTAGDVTVAQLPAKTVVTNAYVVITGAGGTVTTLTVSVGRTGAGYIDYIVASDAKAAANTVYGDTSGERGTNMTGYDLPSFTAVTDVKAHFVSTGGNLSTVTGSSGAIYIETMQLP